ncbi:MAG: RlmE family RNA methyltransferase [Spirochaetaceae bacterium]|jgi:23S rRNA (uridine2552-2'-O)-methyltransferase|nr:RlmE family RNA methyltransferase [Spirochaetaceae bacterium]
MKAHYEKSDFWAEKARKEDYPARSVYKLREIDKKFKLLGKNANKPFHILDLGAAPGSWSLYVLRHLSGSGFLCACDLKPLSREFDANLFDNTDRFFFLQGDFTQDENHAIIERYAPYGLIISDAAPATSGMRSLDTARSLALSESVLESAQKTLSPAGNLVIKIFQGGESPEFLKKIRLFFNEVKTFKPSSCRSNSFETYVIALGKK